MASSSRSAPPPPSQDQDQNRNPSIISVNLDPTQHQLLNFPWPYHSAFPPTPSSSQKLSTPFNSLTAFFANFRFRYAKVAQDQDTDVENGKDEDGGGDGDREDEQKRLMWQDYEERSADRWFALLFLLLLFSVLFNVFFLFNGPPGCLPGGGKWKGKGNGEMETHLG